MMKPGRVIATLREAVDWTQEALAARCKRSRNWIALVENGHVGLRFADGRRDLAAGFNVPRSVIDDAVDGHMTVEAAVVAVRAANPPPNKPEGDPCAR